MKILSKKYSFAFLAMFMALLLLSACSQTTSGSTPSNNTPQQVLQKSADAMQKLTSTHMELRSTNSIQTSGSTSATPTETNTTGNDAKVTPVPADSNLNVSITGSGDQVFPDQQQLKLSVNALNQKYDIAEVMKGDKIYLQDQNQKWFVFNKSDYAGVVSDPLAGVTFDQQTLLGIVQNVKLEDHGTVTLNGLNVRHLTAILDKEALKKLVEQNPQLKSTFGQQNVETVLNSAKKFVSSADVWIDEDKFYVHRTQLKIDLTADTSAVGNNAPPTVTTKLDTTLDLSKFNDPVTITEPTDATPSKDPSVIFGTGQNKQ